MEICLNLRQLILGAAAVGLVILLALIGHAVTPVAEDSAAEPGNGRAFV